jgi:hypothetical protein
MNGTCRNGTRDDGERGSLKRVTTREDSNVRVLPALLAK